MLPRRNNPLHSRILRIHRHTHNIIPPPTRRLNIIQRERKEDENRTQCQSQIQARRGEVIETAPPSEILLPYHFLENESYDAPTQIIEWSSRRNTCCTSEDEGSHEIFDGTIWPFACGEVEDDRNYCAEAEEPEEGGVDLARGENALGSNETPDDGCGEEDTSAGTREVIFLVGGADVFDVCEGEI